MAGLALASVEKGLRLRELDKVWPVRRAGPRATAGSVTTRGRHGGDVAHLGECFAERLPCPVDQEI